MLKVLIEFVTTCIFVQLNSKKMASVAGDTGVYRN